MIGPFSAILCDGAPGGVGNLFFGGHGGGGSGGQIWLQSFADVDISSSANLSCSGGAPGISTISCSNHAGGSGGEGLYQLEDQDGMVNTAFLGPAPGAGNIVALQFPFSGGLTATATSGFYDTGYGAPTYSSASFTADLGTIPGATADVVFEAAHEVASGGAPDLATLSAPVSASAISSLDGHRYIRFTALLAYPLPTGIPPPATGAPSILSVSMGFNTPLNCNPEAQQ